MPKFPAPHSEPNADGWTRTLVKDWKWRVEMRGKEYALYIPAPIRYEPSIPTAFESVIPSDRLEPASLPHDVIYKLKGDFSQTSHRVLQVRETKKQAFQNIEQTTRLFADDLFRKILQTMGVAKWRTWLAYRAVRWFGQHAWDEKDGFQLPEPEASSQQNQT